MSSNYFLVGELVLIACLCSRTAPWATLEELLDKLVFLTVSGDGMFLFMSRSANFTTTTFLDPAFISHFLLTYRRFASPRSVLLAMQKRMRQLDTASGDPMFACFAQMRYSISSTP